MRTHALCTLTLFFATLVGCANMQATGGQGRPDFPLHPCQSPKQTGCVERMFASDEGIDSRDLHRFPKRYLELWDSSVRQEECERLSKASQAESLSDCVRRLTSLSDYFNPNDQRPSDDVIGVALEGGGGKSAPFALGVLAGLQQLGLFSQEKIGAIASVSGGSYAASFLFNRLLDEYERRPMAGDFEHWFRSCVPDAYGQLPYLASLASQGLPLCGELADKAYTYNRFKDEFAFQGQVWQYPKILFHDDANRLEADPATTLPKSVLSTGILLGETGLSLPFQHVGRGIFRWPYNSAPSKVAYMYGLEREYGYSPHDWLQAECAPEQKARTASTFAQPSQCTPVQKARTTLRARQARSLAALSEVVKNGKAPRWIIVSSTPGAASPVGWFTAFSRDPVRHQFELTPEGYGSGIHGYARMAPESLPRLVGNSDASPEQMSIIDAVAASSAFFDEEQSLYSQQPKKAAFAATQGLLNITWFTEIRNFNAGTADRSTQNVLPWPFWAITAGRTRTTPYIHLQDGGNSENTAILPLLRRGYRTIVYVHGTEDRRAELKDICHLKNQLEFDATYVVRSPEFDAMAIPMSTSTTGDSSPRFTSYLDQLCSEEIDVSDLATFDGNSARKGNARTQAVAKLYCGRLGYPIGRAERTEYDPGYKPCEEYVQRFSGPLSIVSSAPVPRTFLPLPSLFFERSLPAMKFFVYRGDALAFRRQSLPEQDLLSTIVFIVPSVSFDDFRSQLQHSPSEAELGITSWADYCQLSQRERNSLRVATCFGPNGQLFDGMGTRVLVSRPVISCTAMAHILADKCAADNKPSFPHDTTVGQTWNSSYTQYASYFDLGRHQALRAWSEFGAHTAASSASAQAAVR